MANIVWEDTGSLAATAAHIVKRDFTNAQLEQIAVVCMEELKKFPTLASIDVEYLTGKILDRLLKK